MPTIQINMDKISSIRDAIKLCPFGAIEHVNGSLQINAACKMCNICIKQGPKKRFSAR